VIFFKESCRDYDIFFAILNFKIFKQFSNFLKILFISVTLQYKHNYSIKL